MERRSIVRPKRRIGAAAPSFRRFDPKAPPFSRREPKVPSVGRLTPAASSVDGCAHAALARITLMVPAEGAGP
jgi:hypothetical protein